MAEHHYEIAVEWTGNAGRGTSSYQDYGRSHVVSADGLPEIHGTADPSFRGSADAWNPEQLFLAALSQCHLLTYLALCAKHGVVVTEYVDEPVGTLTSRATGGGLFTDVLLRPRVTVASADQVTRRMVCMSKPASCASSHNRSASPCATNPRWPVNKPSPPAARE